MTLIKNAQALDVKVDDLINGLNIKYKNMTKKQLQKEWEEVFSETRKKSEIGEQLKDERVSLLGDILLCVQVLLSKVEAGENSVFNEMIYKKTMNFYRSQIKKYV